MAVVAEPTQREEPTRPTKRKPPKETHVAWYLGQVQNTERQVAEAFSMVAAKHDRDADIRDVGNMLAKWSWAHVEAVKPLIERYGEHTTPDAEQLRGALFHGNRFGGFGLLRDLQDLVTLVTRARMLWTDLIQAAHGAKDQEMERLAEQCCNDTWRQLSWLQAEIKQVAPEAISDRAELDSELSASVPKRPTAAALPAALWAPLAGGGLLAGVGIVGLLAGQPWLVPSLGPTAYLQAERPADPSARFYNTVVGHLIGLAAGFVALAVFNAWGAPAVLQAKELVPVRLAAAVLALILTLGLAPLIRASHPPAGATTLLVALGSLQTPKDALNVAIGVVIIALLGEGLRRLRLMKPFGADATAAQHAAGAPGAWVPSGGRE